MSVKEINYKMDYASRVIITKCMHYPHIRIGSTACTQCAYNHGHNASTKTVKCDK